MKYLTDTWLEATELFNNIMGLHDSTVIDVAIVLGQNHCTLALNEVYQHSEGIGFHLAYKILLVEMLGTTTITPQQADGLIGYDIVDAELRPGSLWIKTLAGSMLFRFESIRFAIPDAKQ